MAMNYNPETGEYEQYQDFFDPIEEEKTPQQLADEMRARMNADNTNPNHQRRPGYFDLEYWREQGVNEGDIFDTTTGQIKPGWQRTANGYERVAQEEQRQTPYSSSGPTNQWGYLTEPFLEKPPAWRQGPTYTAPKWEPPPPFSYKEFQTPTKDSMYADPSFQFREGQGRQALEQSAAGKGVLRTGGTLKDLVNYGQNAASQEYSNIFGRAVDSHNIGLQQALGTYGVNYGVSKDQRDYLYDTSKAEFAPQQRENELMNERDFSSFLANFDIFERNRRRAGDYLTWAAEQGGA